MSTISANMMYMTGGTLGGVALARAKNRAATGMVQSALDRLAESELDKQRQKEVDRAKSEYHSPLVDRINPQQGALKTTETAASGSVESQYSRLDSIEITDTALAEAFGSNRVEDNLLNVLRQVFTDDQIKSLVSGEELPAEAVWAEGKDPAAEIRGLINELQGTGSASGQAGEDVEIGSDKNAVAKTFASLIDSVGKASENKGVAVTKPGFMGFSADQVKNGFDYFAKYKHRLNDEAVRNLTDNDKVFVGMLYAKAEDRIGPYGDPEVSYEFKKVDKIAYKFVIYNMTHDIGDELKTQEEARKLRAKSGEELSEADPASKIRQGKNPDAPDSAYGVKGDVHTRYVDTTKFSREDAEFKARFNEPKTTPKIDLAELRAK